jgi:DNA (cytosine-5)-methyltransferase 1
MQKDGQAGEVRASFGDRLHPERLKGSVDGEVSIHLLGVSGNEVGVIEKDVSSGWNGADCMRVGSICSGIGAPEAAWRPLGWDFAFCSEIEPFPSAVLKHHYPEVPNLGDFTRIQRSAATSIDLLVGGTPCQSFSVAGKRAGLDDPRGHLTIEFLRLADRLRPRWLVWENVPGVLSDDGGRTFGTFLGLLGKLGYGFAYRILDAQFAGVPQRRRRVFVVGHLGDWRRAAAVLFERHSLSGNPAPRREKGQRVAGTIKGGSGERGYPDPSDGNGGGLIGVAVGPSGGEFTDTSCTLDSRCKDGAIRNQLGMLVASTGDISHCLNAGGMGRQDYETETLIAHSLRGDGFDASEDGTGRGTPLVPIAFSAKDHGADAGEIAPTLRAGGHADSHANAGVMPAVMYSIQSVNMVRERKQNGIGISESEAMYTVTGRDQHAVAFAENQRAEVRVSDVAPQLSCAGGKPGSGYPATLQGMAVRRLTPAECEKLQGFEPGYTLIPWRGKMSSDGPRYKAIGNSMAIPVVRWLGKRIQEVEDLAK